MKYLIYSLGNIVLSRVHLVLNKFSSPIKTSKIIYSEYEHRSVLKPISDKLKGKYLIQPNSMFINSFFQRINSKEKFHFNNIISKPFIKICLSEISFRKNYKTYMKKNFYFFLKKDKKIKKIVMIDEYSVPNLALSKVAKNKKIKVFELQHGNIHANHPGYIYPKKLKNKIALPDYLMTYGEYEKELLTKKSIWNENQVIPLGCPRYDFLATYKLNKNKLKEKLSIPKDKKILFWPTQTHDKLMSESGENELNSDIVFKSLKKQKDWFLVIKLHPGEDKNKSFKFYKSFINKYKLNSCVVLNYNDVDTYDCIGLSDALVLKHTTVGMEAILMNKPVINLELKKSWDISQFKFLKSALVVRQEKDLSLFLNKLLTKEYQKLFKRERDKYVKNHFTNFGDSTKKIVEFIKNV